jgi:hypothetical protein
MTLRKVPRAPSLACVIATLGQATEDPIEESGSASLAGRTPLQQMSGSRSQAQPAWDRGRRDAPPVGSRGTDDHTYLEGKGNA